jgi:hypothetical protein
MTGRCSRKLGSRRDTMRFLARIMHETPWRDRGDGCATRSASACGACRATTGARTSGVLESTLQSELVLSLSKEDPRTPGFRLVEKDGHIRGCSRWFVHNAG